MAQRSRTLDSSCPPAEPEAELRSRSNQRAQEGRQGQSDRPFSEQGRLFMSLPLGTSWEQTDPGRWLAVSLLIAPPHPRPRCQLGNSSACGCARTPACSGGKPAGLPRVQPGEPSAGQSLHRTRRRHGRPDNSRHTLQTRWCGRPRALNRVPEARRARRSDVRCHFKSLQL